MSKAEKELILQLPTIVNTVGSTSTRHTTLVQAIFTLAKTAIGAGVLFLPYSFMQVGLLLGPPLLLLTGLLSILSLHFLARMAGNTGYDNYFSLGRLAYGRIGESTATATLLVFLMAGLILYITKASGYIGSSVANLVNRNIAETWYLQSANLTFLIGTFVVFPLSCLKDLSKLAKASVLGLLCIVFVVALTVIDYFAAVSTLGAARIADLTLIKVDLGIFSVFSSMLFAFSNHFTLVTLVPALDNPTSSRRMLLIIWSTSIAATLYLLTGLFGYLHFGNDVQRDILDSLVSQSAVSHVARFAVGLTLLFSFPLLCDPTRDALDFLLTLAIGSPKNAKRASIRHYLQTFAIVLVTGLIAAFCTGQVVDILVVSSAFCGSLISFIFPALYFLQLGRLYKIHRAERILAWLLIIVGGAVCVFGTTDAINALIKSFYNQSLKSLQ